MMPPLLSPLCCRSRPRAAQPCRPFSTRRSPTRRILAMAQFRTLDQLDVAGKRVLVRLDLNVPVKDGRVSDPTRIDRSSATVQALIDRDAKVVILSHFGRPDGKRVESMSLRPIAE